MTLKPSKGFILITPQKQMSGFSIPDEKGNLRSGIVTAIGGNIIHASGKDLPSPVNVGDIVVFQYLENQDKDGSYLVPFNLIAGYYEK